MKPCIYPDFYSLQEGYPYRMDAGRKVYVVREVLEKKLGRSLKDEEIALNNCGTRGCLEPEHIELGNRTERVARTVRAKKHSYGESRPASKLKDNDILEIKKRLGKGEQGSILASEYGVNKSQISRIRNNKTWNHVEKGDYE